MKKHEPIIIIDAHHYPIELEQKLATAQKRIVISAMLIGLDTITEDLFTHMKAALERGVTVHLAPDAFSFSLFGPPIAAYGHLLKARRQAKQTLLLMNEMKRRGATVQIIGTVGKNPYKHRFHQKFTIIDDEVYFGGGINFSAEHFRFTDYMLHLKSSELAAVLIQELKDIETHGDLADFSFAITPGSILLIDGGIPGSSCIYDRAVALAKQATTITYVSQMTPSGELASILRKKHAACYFTRPSQMGGPGVASQVLDQFRHATKNLYQHEDYIHAKFILFSMPNGKNVLLSGSHNFSKRGVEYGTKELAIESTDPALWDQFTQFVEKYIA